MRSSRTLRVPSFVLLGLPPYLMSCETPCCFLTKMWVPWRQGFILYASKTLHTKNQYGVWIQEHHICILTLLGNLLFEIILKIWPSDCLTHSRWSTTVRVNLLLNDRTQCTHQLAPAPRPWGGSWLIANTLTCFSPMGHRAAISF